MNSPIVNTGIPLIDESFKKVHEDFTYTFLFYYFLYSIAFSVYLLEVHALHGSSISLFNALFSGLALYLLKKKGSLRQASIVFLLSNFLSVTAFLIIANKEIGLLQGMWLVLLNLFAHINLGKKWSRFIFILILLVFNPIAFLKFQHYEVFQDSYRSDLFYQLSVIINLIASFIGISYIVQTFIDKRREAGNQAYLQQRGLNEELSNTKHFIESVLCASPNLIWIKDYEMGKTIYANMKANAILGYSLHELQEMGNSTADFMLHPEDLHLFHDFINSKVLLMNDGEVTEIEFRIYDNKKNLHWFLASYTIFLRTPEGKAKQVLVNAQDITIRKRAEEQLKEAKEKAELATQEKAQFLSTMSHEIRTPLNAVVGYSHFLLEEKPRPDQLESLQTLQFSANHLLSLINDILDFSKIDAGKIEFEQTEFDLKELMEGILSVFQLKAQEKKISLSLHYGVELRYSLISDPTRLSQIITNLVGNAIKFTEKGGVKLEYYITNETDSELTFLFSVKDTGIGIAKDKQDSIFESFTQAGSGINRKYGGTGLGLAICKKLVELQGSRLKVFSEPGKGSSFSFELPFRKGRLLETREIILPLSKERSGLNGMKILLAEDNHINVMLANKFLKKWDISVDVAEDGEIAVQMVQQKKYDLVLMDLQMPCVDGYEATQRIRALDGEYFRLLPIVALTASVSLDARTQVISKGMNDHLTKPFNPDELHRVLKKYWHPPL